MGRYYKNVDELKKAISEYIEKSGGNDNLNVAVAVMLYPPEKPPKTNADIGNDGVCFHQQKKINVGGLK